METRKVQLSGGTTYTVSLPKSWAEEHSIDAGCTVRLEPNEDGTLLVEPVDTNRDTERTARVDIEKHGSEGIIETIKAMYAVGFDSLELVDASGHPSERERSVSEFLRMLSGFEILEQDDTSLELQNLIDARNISIRKNALRMQLTTLGMYRDAMEAVLTGDSDLGDDVIRRDEEANKIYAMVARQFRRSLSNLETIQALEQSRATLFEYYYVVNQLENIADNATQVVRVCRNQPASLPPEFHDQIEEFGTAAIRIVERAFEAFLQSGNVKEIYRILERYETLLAELEEYNRELYSHDVDTEAHLVSRLVSLQQRTADCGGLIAKMALQRTLRRDEALSTVSGLSETPD